MSNKTFGRIALGIVAFAALTTVGRCYSSQQAAWEARVERVQAEAARLREHVEAERAAVDSLTRENATLAADISQRSSATDTLIVNLPPAETPSDSARDRVIVRLQGERDDALAALDSQLKATARLQAALDDAITRGDSLRDVLDDRPSARPWWLPRVGLGATAGLDTQGRPNTVAGVSLVWEVNFGGGA